MSRGVTKYYMTQCKVFEAVYSVMIFVCPPILSLTVLKV